MEYKQKITIINMISIIMLVICLILSGFLIILSTLKSNIEIAGKNTEELIKNYTLTEDTSTTNTWNISATENDNVIATLLDNGTLTIYGTGNMKNWTYISNIDWYDMKDKVTTVVIETGVTSIGNNAFNGCESLTSIEIAESITSIGSEVFSNCDNLMCINVKEDNTTYKDEDGVLYTKDGTKIIRYPSGKIEKEYVILAGVTSIGNDAFYSCESLTSVEIPESVTSIEENPLYNCKSLININVNEKNKSYKDENGVLYTKDGTKIIRYPEGKKENEYIVLEGVTSIEAYAFIKCESLTSIEIPEGVTSIGNNAFSGCTNLTSIEIPKGVTSIGNRAFYMCTNLTNIEIPDSATSIGDSAFYCCQSLISIKIPKGVTSIGNNAFRSCINLKSIEILEGVENIGDSAFNDCKSLVSIEIPEGVTSIGNSAFYCCQSLINVDIPESITSIGDYAFNLCPDLMNLEIPKNIKYIGKNVFQYCTVTNLIDINNDIELPNILKRTQDENDLLYSSSGFYLTNCTIEENNIKITDINSCAIIEVAEGKLKYLQYKFKINSWDISATENDNIIAMLSDDGILTISGTGNMKNWTNKCTTDWHGLKIKVKKVIIEEGVISIGAHAFDSCSRLTSIKIPEGVTSIGEHTFDSCRELTSVEIPESVTSIGCDSFQQCKSLKNIEVDENNTVYKDDNGVLYTKNGTKIIKYPSGKEETKYEILFGTTIIENSAFYGCYSLTSIEIPESVSNIGNYAFYGCQNLINVEIPNGVRSIGDYTFDSCYNLTSIQIPEGVTSIGKLAFYDCNSLISIYIPKTVESIGEKAFADSHKLTVICDKGTMAEKYVKENIRTKYDDTRYLINYLNYLIISKINPETTIEEMKTKIESYIEYDVINKNSEIISETSYAVTGYKIRVESNDLHTLIVTGDCTGDGKADIQDIFAINKHRLNNGKLINEYLLAGDANRDGKTNINDIFEINKYRLGIKEIL